MYLSVFMKLDVPKPEAATEPSELLEGPQDMKIQEQQPNGVNIPEPLPVPNGPPEKRIIVYVKCGAKIHTRKSQQSCDSPTA